MLSASARVCAEDDRDEVVAEMRPQGAAGRGRRDEVELAAEPHVLCARGRLRVFCTV